MARRIAGVAALALLSVLMAASGAAGRDFYVGGRAGWAPNPDEPFNAWAERNRFQVNDTLVFRYSKDADAVLVVSQGHYDACNATQPALRLDGGDSRFVFHSSGPYFFISPDAARCRAGERLIVVVLAVRDDGTSASSPPPPPAATSSPPPVVVAPAPRSLPAAPPKPAPTSSTPPPSKSSSSPPPPAPHALPTPPPLHPVPGRNASSPSPSPSHSPAPAPAPAPGTNGTSLPPPSPSSAVALRVGFMACLLIAGAAILV